MARLSKRPEGNKGSLKKGDTYREAYFVWDDEKETWFIKDRIGGKKYGPFASIAEANETGKVEFYYDFGKRSGTKNTTTTTDSAHTEQPVAA